MIKKNLMSFFMIWVSLSSMFFAFLPNEAIIWGKLPWLILLIFVCHFINIAYRMKTSSLYLEESRYVPLRYGVSKWPKLGPILKLLFLPIFTSIPLFLGIYCYLEQNYIYIRKKTEPFTIVGTYSDKNKNFILKHELIGTVSINTRIKGIERNWKIGDRVQGTVIKGYLGSYLQNLK